MADTTTAATEKRTVEEIVSEEISGERATALSIHDLQVAALNFTDEYRDQNKAGRPVMWDIVDYSQIPRDFYELCLKVAEFEVRL